jgi:hypothetical protein
MCLVLCVRLVCLYINLRMKYKIETNLEHHLNSYPIDVQKSVSNFFNLKVDQFKLDLGKPSLKLKILTSLNDTRGIEQRFEF